MAKLVLQLLNYSPDANFCTLHCFDEFETPEQLLSAFREKKMEKKPTFQFYGETFVGQDHGKIEVRVFTLEDWFAKEAADRKSQIRVAI